MCPSTCNFAEGPLRGRGTNQWSPHTFLLMDYHWLGDGFPTIVLKDHDGSLNLDEFHRFYQRCDPSFYWRSPTGQGDKPMVPTYFPPRGLSLARRWISYNCFKGSWWAAELRWIWAISPLMCPCTCNIAEGPLRGRGTNQWSPPSFLLMDYHWWGDGIYIFDIHLVSF